MSKKMTETEQRYHFLVLHLLYLQLSRLEKSHTAAVHNSDCHHREKRAAESSSEEGCSALILITYFFWLDVLLPLELMSRSSKPSHEVESSSS